MWGNALRGRRPSNDTYIKVSLHRQKSHQITSNQSNISSHQTNKYYNYHIVVSVQSKHSKDFREKGCNKMIYQKEYYLSEKSLLSTLYKDKNYKPKYLNIAITSGTLQSMYKQNHVYCDFGFVNSFRIPVFF